MSRSWVTETAFGLILVLAAAGCGSSGNGAGVYLATIENGAPGWIGSPPGEPVWSPAGTAIAWGTEDGLFMFDVASAAVRMVSGQPIAGLPAWSPDGTALAFVDRDRASLEIIDSSSGTVRFSIPVSNPAASRPVLSVLAVGGPAWSPDGREIAFSCWDGNGDEICVVDRNGGNRRQLTEIEASTASGSSPAIANAGRPSWSPDGQLLAAAVYSERRGAPAGVFTIDPDAGEARKLSGLLPNSEIRWSLDGAAVFYSTTVDGRSDAFRIPIDGGEPLNLSEGFPGGARWPALSPDGLQLAMASAGDIILLDLSSGEFTSVGSELHDIFPAWSPEGDAIAFEAAQELISAYDQP